MIVPSMNIYFNYKYKNSYFFLRQLLCFLRKKYLSVNSCLQTVLPDNSKEETGFMPTMSYYQSYLFTENWVFYVFFLQQHSFYLSMGIYYGSLNFEECLKNFNEYKFTTNRREFHSLPLLDWNCQHYYFILAYILLKQQKNANNKPVN